MRPSQAAQHRNLLGAQLRSCVITNESSAGSDARSVTFRVLKGAQHAINVADVQLLHAHWNEPAHPELSNLCKRPLIDHTAPGFLTRSIQQISIYQGSMAESSSGRALSLRRSASLAPCVQVPAWHHHLGLGRLQANTQPLVGCPAESMTEHQCRVVLTSLNPTPNPRCKRGARFGFGLHNLPNIYQHSVCARHSRNYSCQCMHLCWQQPQA